MLLRTLGRLKLEADSFKRPKPLLLLVYVALEGPQERRHLAELFWPDAARHMKSLTVALAQLRQGAPGSFDTDEHRIRAAVTIDAKQFLAQLEEGEYESALELYKGPFLEGFYLEDWGVELEEWLYTTREFLAGRAREALLVLAEREAAKGRFDIAAKHAEAAYNLAGAAIPEPEELGRFHTLLIAGNSPLAAEVAKEAEGFGLTVVTSDKAKAQLKELGQKESTVKYNLPTPSTPFIGRKEELAEIKRLMLEEIGCRLLTLVGPGGIGKTRLGLEVGASLLTAFPDGVFFVPLTPVSSPSGIVSAIAEAVGFQFYSNIPPERQLLDYFRDEQALLLLDNFEHLIEGAGLIAELLKAAPAVKLVVTSRESLHLQEEWSYPIDGLTFPSEDEQGDKLLDYDAVRLFEGCARRAQTRFPLAAKQAQVARICQLVEGMPLALELAASWLRALPIESIVHELERGLDILTTRHHNLPERHQSMRVVLEQSWRLLADEERDALERLSVFRGGFRQDAAQKVTRASLPILATLVEKSLLRVNPSGRYGMHELLRQFASEKLAEDSQDEVATREQHCSYYLEFLKSREVKLVAPEQRQALEEIGDDFDNVRTAWEWAIANGDLGMVGDVVNSLYWFFTMRSRFQEGYGVFAQAASCWQAIAEQPETVDVVGRLLAKQGALSLFLGAYEEAKQALETSLPCLKDERDRAFSLAMLGRVAHLQGDRGSSEKHFADSIAISRAIGDLHGLADALNGLSDMRSSFANFETGRALASECLTICRRLARPDLIATSLALLAWPTNCLGAYEEAEGYWQESLVLHRDIGNRLGVAVALNFLGWSAWCAGSSRLAEAVTYMERALAVYREVGHRTHIAMCLGDLALVNNELDEHAEAMEYALEGLANAREIGNFDLVPYNLLGLGTAHCGLGNLGAGRACLLEAATLSVQRQVPDFEAISLYFLAKLLVKESEIEEAQERVKRVQAVELLSLVLQQPACWQAIKDRAKRLLADLEETLPADSAAEARARGKSLSVEAALSSLDT